MASTAPTARRELAHSGLSEVLPRLFKALRTRLASEIPGLGRVTPDQFGILAAIADTGGSTMGELAVARGIALNSASALVERLVNAGLAAREHDLLDRRVVRVTATERGAHLVAKLRLIRAREFKKMVEQLPESELDAIVGALPALDHLADLARTIR